MKAVVLAGGQGIRLRPITDEAPKAMIQVGSKPFLQRILENLQKAGISEVLMVVGYKREVIEDFFKEDFKGMKITYFVQQKALGTAHAVSLVESYVKENFLVLNGDVLVESNIFSDLSVVDEFDLFDSIIVAREVRDPWRYGCLLIEGDKVKNIIEKPSPGQEPSKLVNAGVYRFSPNIFQAIKKTDLSKREEFELVDSIKILINSGKKIGFKKYTGLCLDIGNKEDLRKAQEFLVDWIYKLKFCPGFKITGTVFRILFSILALKSWGSALMFSKVL